MYAEHVRFDLAEQVNGITCCCSIRPPLHYDYTRTNAETEKLHLLATANFETVWGSYIKKMENGIYILASN